MKEFKFSAYAGWAYVLFWIVGLLLEPGSPTITTSPAEIFSYYESHRVIHMIQAFLIDGAAGIALLIYISGLTAFFTSHSTKDWSILISMYGAGLIAVSLSLVQGAFQQILSSTVMTTEGMSPVVILSVISFLDTFKLTSLSVMVLLASIQAFKANSFHPWVRWTGILLSLLLLAGGFSFLVNASVLTVALFVSLPVLLIWVAVISIGLFQNQVSE